MCGRPAPQRATLLHVRSFLACLTVAVSTAFPEQQRLLEELRAPHVYLPDDVYK